MLSSVYAAAAAAAAGSLGAHSGKIGARCGQLFINRSLSRSLSTVTSDTRSLSTVTSGTVTSGTVTSGGNNTNTSTTGSTNTSSSNSNGGISKTKQKRKDWFKKQAQYAREANSKLDDIKRVNKGLRTLEFFDNESTYHRNVLRKIKRTKGE